MLKRLELRLTVEGRLHAPWPDTASDTWLQDSTVAMTGAERAEAGSGPTGCVRADVHRSPHVITPSRDAVLREEAKRGPQESTEGGKGPTVRGRRE